MKVGKIFSVVFVVACASMIVWVATSYLGLSQFKAHASAPDGKILAFPSTPEQLVMHAWRGLGFKADQNELSQTEAASSKGVPRATDLSDFADDDPDQTPECFFLSQTDPSRDHICMK